MNILAIIAALGIYAKTFYVKEINYDTDIVVVEDFSGNEFEFYGTEDWIEGDFVSSIMYNNGTETITDDVILTATYSGCGFF